MQCEYNVILRGVRATIDAVEKQQVLHIPCVCVCVCVRARAVCVCVCVFVALDIQHELPMLHTVTCALSKSTIFVHIIS
jgi:hypothetical protein